MTSILKLWFPASKVMNACTSNRSYRSRRSSLTLYEEVGKLKNGMNVNESNQSPETSSNRSEIPVLTHSEMCEKIRIDVEEQSRLVGIIGEYLKNQIQINDAYKLDPSAGILKYFDGPEIGYDITLFLERICSNSHCSPSCLVLSLIYLERLQEGFSSPILTSKTAKRLLLVSIMIAAKYLEDRYFKNSSWAKMARISLADLNTMELELLFAIDFRLTVAHDEYSAQVVALLRFAAPYHPSDIMIRPDAPHGSASASSSHHLEEFSDGRGLHPAERDSESNAALEGEMVLGSGRRMTGHDRPAELAADMPSLPPCGPEGPP